MPHIAQHARISMNQIIFDLNEMAVDLIQSEALKKKEREFLVEMAKAHPKMFEEFRQFNKPFLSNPEYGGSIMDLVIPFMASFRAG